MRYRKTPAANAARRRGRRYRLASAFPRRRYLPAADVSFLSSSSVSPPLLHYPRLLSSHVLTYPAPSPPPPSLFFSLLASFSLAKIPFPPTVLSTLYSLSPLDMSMYIYIHLAYTRSSSACTQPPSIHPPFVLLSPLSLSTGYSPLRLEPPSRHQFPAPPPPLLSPPPAPLPPPRLFSIRRGNRCCSGPELVQNRWARATSGKGVAGNPLRGNFSPSQLPTPSPSIRPSFTYITPVCAYTRARSWRWRWRWERSKSETETRAVLVCSHDRQGGMEGRWLIGKKGDREKRGNGAERRKGLWKRM